MIPVIPGLPDDLTERDQWVLWRLETRNGKPTKVPYQVDGRHAKSDDSGTWASFEAVSDALRKAPGYQGRGYVFSADDPFAGIDMDNCLDAAGKPKPWAQSIIEQFGDSYAEISPSGHGVKIWVRARLAGPGRRAPWGDGAIEIYDRGRFFTTTGRLFGSVMLPVEDHQANVTKLYTLISGIPKERPKAKADLAKQKTIPEGKRYEYLQSTAAQYRAKGMDTEEIFSALAGINSRRCVPPKSELALRELATWAGGLEPGKRTVVVQMPRPAVEPKVEDRVGLPVVIVGDRELREESADCLLALRAANVPPRQFAQAGRMYEMVTNEKGRLVGRDVTDAGLRCTLTRNADFRRKDRKGILKPCYPPKDVVDAVLGMPPGEWGFPPLDGVVGCPVLRSDGTVLEEAGYDERSRIYYSPEPGFRLPAIAEYPTSDHLDVATGLLDEMLEGFPWADFGSRANAIAGLLTPVLRSIINGPVPMAAITARQAGSGKSLLVEITSLICTGQPAEMSSLPRDAEEMRKALTAHIASMAQIVVFDNVMGRLDSGDLCKALTSTMHSDRVFRTHHRMVMPVLCSWFCTGNNLRLAGDMPRRCFWVRLDAQTSRPELRSDFKIPDLKSWVSARRPELLAALLTLARAWYSAGKPKAKQRPLGSFEHWSEVIGGVLEYAGIEGFLANATEARDEGDVEAGEWERFLQLLEEQFGAVPFSVNDITKKMVARVAPSFGGSPELSEEAEELRRALPGYLAEVADRLGFFQRRAGKLFAEYGGRRFGESQVYLRRAGISHHAQLWAVESGGVSGGKGGVVGS